VIGATIPLTGSFAAFGAQEKIGDNLAVSQINNAGGIKIDGKAQGQGDFLDNQSLPNLVTIRGAHADPSGPRDRALRNDHPAAGDPAVGGRRPAARADGSSHADPGVAQRQQERLQYSWDVFFNEPQQTTTQFLAA
jgi:hypothetical protein